MADSAALADARYREVQALTRAVVGAVGDLWRDVSPDRILAALQGETGLAILRAVTAGQATAAAGAQAFVAASMLAQGATLAPLGVLDPAALVGMAMDGRSLASLLYLPGITTARALAVGEAPELAALRGMTQMAMLTGTTIADTARTATSVAMAAESSCVMYVRVVSLPACSRCIVLAGRTYSYSTGFKRHPQCDCGMRPLSERQWNDPAELDQVKTARELYDSMSPAERHRRFGGAAVKAMEHGADIEQLVNARRGLATAATRNGDALVTTEGTTRRGIGARAIGAAYEKQGGERYARSTERRLMPETIFQLAKGDRELEIAQLKKFGYIT
ncbi:hypothetical protein [Kitasatospora sp. NPDC002040]|uniref:VG15 protein n=1 Tax=Kitasatospora sp. NPDC002040 TaxID=3154661 RepID=UPI003332E7F4